ncbi:MAG TPA: hypothetical protein PKK06_15240 [Phycisphaerae bacterium]|nr:hypothetical protein [Phycisphaerae bacterium]HNU46682.1 hypothetical protein [Phycisphaerae bacterium]
MPAQREKVVVALSGGVDSSVAACLLVEQRDHVTDLFAHVGMEAEAQACLPIPPPVTAEPIPRRVLR